MGDGRWYPETCGSCSHWNRPQRPLRQQNQKLQQPLGMTLSLFHLPSIPTTYRPTNHHSVILPSSSRSSKWTFLRELHTKIVHQYNSFPPHYRNIMLDVARYLIYMKFQKLVLPPSSGDCHWLDIFSLLMTKVAIKPLRWSSVQRTTLMFKSSGIRYRSSPSKQ